MAEFALIPGLSLQFLTLFDVVRNLRGKDILVRRIEREIKRDTDVRTLRGVDMCMHDLAACAGENRQFWLKV